MVFEIGCKYLKASRSAGERGELGVKKPPIIRGFLPVLEETIRNCGKLIHRTLSNK